MFLEHCIRLIESNCLLLSIEKLLVFVQIMFVLLKYLRKALKCSASVQIKLSLLIWASQHVRQILFADTARRAAGPNLNQ